MDDEGYPSFIIKNRLLFTSGTLKARFKDVKQVVEVFSFKSISEFKWDLKWPRAPRKQLNWAAAKIWVLVIWQELSTISLTLTNIKLLKLISLIAYFWIKINLIKVNNWQRTFWLEQSLVVKLPDQLEPKIKGNGLVRFCLSSDIPFINVQRCKDHFLLLNRSKTQLFYKIIFPFYSEAVFSLKN